MPIKSVEVVAGKEMAKKVRSITTLEAYLDFHDNHFSLRGSSEYRKAVIGACEDSDQGQDFYRLLGLLGVQGVQYGFPTLTRQLLRHQKKGWRGSPFDSAHLLALSIYMGKINTQAHSIKQNLAEKIAPDDPEAALGVWNVNFPILDSKVLNHQNPAVIGDIKEKARTRVSRGRPIFLPDQEINQRLAAIDFSGQEAEDMPYETFQRYVLPKAAPVLRWFTNPELAFKNFREVLFPIPKIPLPQIALG